MNQERLAQLAELTESYGRDVASVSQAVVKGADRTYGEQKQAAKDGLAKAHAAVDLYRMILKELAAGDVQ